VLPAFGAPLRLQTVPGPTIGPNDVLLRVRAAIRPVISRTFPLEAAEEAHAVLRKNALVGRAALLLDP